MKAEHLQCWIQEVTREDTPETKNRHKFVSLVQAYFRGGTLEEYFTWHMVVLIPKVGRDFWGIVLVEIL